MNNKIDKILDKLHEIDKKVVFLIILASCSHPKSESNENFDAKPDYDKYVERLPEFSEDGWIVSRNAEGGPEHQGDSLLWTGLAMASLPCDKGDVFEARMQKMITDNKGALVRYEPLGEYAGGREVSFDGATGLYYGILSRLLDCSHSATGWAEVWKLHTDYLKRNFGYLNVNTREALVPEFTLLPHYISYLLKQRGEPHKDRMRSLEAQVASWALAVKVSKNACFRIHLGFIYLLAMEKIGGLSNGGYSGFCKSTTNTDIPMIDDWCGRKNLSEWKFVENEWEYRHQRCGKWETPDGKGYRTPAIDLIFAYSRKVKL